MFKPATSAETARARKLRAEKTPFEKRLWAALRQLNRRGWHFRQQAPFRGYTLDFVEHNARLVIELDGAQHDAPGHRVRDEVRDGVLTEQGYLTLRFWNSEVREDLTAVVERILFEAQKRRKKSVKTATPSPTRKITL
ncbi:MAG: DUF559 domain-containing protein [Alphaproteobacteria bacterium]|nr:DUF559 domain-containing protein [Alphaproteobacteria bacterium]MBV9418424.1 DUF559 domain-containing protein [Alphaproteobacteria bacterium]MBV9542303.1 DUF559 domain-containing protein [Alphaproteobacteria bacterium]MBV9905162.1 DUF559 domain-containing protein [Alphaproteobacteria bacterium]